MNAGISRRSFLASGAAGIAGAGMLGALAAHPAQAEETASQSDATQSEIQWAEAADVIVVGGGGSGFCAAIEAGRAGSSVLILEKSGVCGGDTAASQGMIMAAGTKEQAELAGCDTDTPEAFAEQQVAYAQGFANEDMIREMCLQSPESITFMTDLGRVYKQVDVIPPAWEFDTETSWGPRSHWDKDGMTGHFAVLKDAVDSMDNVKYYTEAPVAHLIKGADNDIIGVTTADGVNYRANKAVILACGSFGTDKEMAHRYNHLLYWFQTVSEKMGIAPFGTSNCSGDGVRMGLEVGAGLALCESAVSSNYCETGGVGSGHINDDMGIDYKNEYNSSAIPGRILVNANGRRFVQEDALWGYVNSAVYREAIRCNWTAETEPKIWFIQDSKWQAFDGNAQAALSNPDLATQCKSADTLEELAELIGVPAQNLVDTVDRWNEACAAGEDGEFKRRIDMETIEVGPFNAYPFMPINSGGFGGVDADIDTHVLDVAGNPIPRLFAAGTVMSGTWCGQFYASCGWAILGTVHWGRKSGQKAAELEPWTTEEVVPQEPVEQEETPAPAAGNYAAGAYTTTGEGFGGEVPVTVTFGDTVIESVEIGENSETPSVGGQAIEALPQMILDAQSAEIDVVSGATFTSQAVLGAVQDCIDQASL